MVDRSQSALLRKLSNRLTSVERRLGRGAFNLPPRLTPTGAEVTDWNDATAVGFYWCENTAANSPYPDRFLGQVFVMGGDGPLAGRIVQEVRIPTTGVQGQATWRRFYSGTWSAWSMLNTKMTGTAAQRAQLAPSPRYWDFWYDTDTQKMMVGSKSGTWRQYAGSIVAATRAWDTTQGASGQALLAGRTDSLTIPTVIEASEDLNVFTRSVGSGFGIVSVSVTTRNPTNTVVSVRLMQLMSHVTQAYSLGWEIVPSAVA